MGVSQLQQQNIPAAAAYTEYSVKIPPGIMKPTFVLRPGGSTGSATPANLFWYMASSPNGSNNAAGLPAIYNTIPLQMNRTIEGKLGGQTIYFQVDQANQVLEVDYFGDN
jgi:hypothetical protein